MELLRGQQRESLGERKARLGPEDRISARARAVGFVLPVLQYMAQQIKILNHSDNGFNLLCRSIEGNQGAPRGCSTGWLALGGCTFVRCHSPARASRNTTMMLCRFRCWLRRNQANSGSVNSSAQIQGSRGPTRPQTSRYKPHSDQKATLDRKSTRLNSS